MLEPIFLIPFALLTGAVAIGHLVYQRRCVAPENDYKNFECKIMSRVFGTLSVITIIALLVQEFWP
jgi:hypothetical protein